MAQYLLNQRQLDMVASCIARANVEGAFAGCVVPTIGESVGTMLEKVRANPVPETVKLWSLTVDSDDGTFTTVSADLPALAARAAAIVADEWSTCDELGPMPDDWREAYAVLQDKSWDTYLTLTEHDVALPGIAPQGQEERIAAELESMAAGLPELISNAELQDRPALARIILAADDLSSRISLEARDALKCGAWPKRGTGE